MVLLLQNFRAFDSPNFRSACFYFSFNLLTNKYHRLAKPRKPEKKKKKKKEKKLKLKITSIWWLQKATFGGSPTDIKKISNWITSIAPFPFHVVSHSVGTIPNVYSFFVSFCFTLI